MDGVEGGLEEGSEPSLPDELWLAVFTFLSDGDLLACALVCSRWHLLTQDARILCDKKFYGKVKKSTLMAAQNSYKALYYKKSLIENRNWMLDEHLYESLLSETGEVVSQSAKRKRPKRKPALVLTNDRLQMSSMMFNDQYLVAGTSLPDQNIEDLQNLIIEKTIGVWKRETLDTSVLKRAEEEELHREEKKKKKKKKEEEEDAIGPDHILRGHRNSIYSLLLGNTEATSSTIVSGSSDETIMVWDLDRMDSTMTLAGHKGSVYCLAWQQEANIVFSGGKDKTIKVWDLKSEAMINDLANKEDMHKRSVVTMDILPHLNYLASGGLDRALKLWDIETGACVKTEKKAHHGWISCVKAGPHHLMCTAGDTKIKVWDTRTLDSVMSIRKMKGPQPVGYFVSALQFDQNKVVSGSVKGTVAVFDMCTARRINKFRAHKRRVADLQFDDTKLVTASLDKKVKIWLFDEPLTNEDASKGSNKCLLS